MTAKTQLIVALDVDTPQQAFELVDTIGAHVQWYKVGKQLFTRYGPAVLDGLKQRGKQVFLDLKYHDIPNTVAQAVRAAAAIGADMTNVHAGGGPTMLKAAAEAAAETGILVIGVTVLTSLDAAELAAVGIQVPPAEQVLRLASLSRQCGLPGVVCSPLEIELIHGACGPEFVLVVPGIRPAGSSKGDQKRVMTPGEAARAGAQYIVVGRPVTAAAEPGQAAAGILREIAMGIQPGQ